MTGSVGPKGSVKRASEFLGEPVDGATQIESQGGVLKSMTDPRGLLFGLAGRLLRLPGQAYDPGKALEETPPGEPLPVPRHAVLAVTPTALHVIPASDTGRMKKGASALSLPLADVVSVSIEEKKVVTDFTISLAGGQVVTAETKRVGANKHNIDVLRLLKSRAEQRAT